MNDIPNEVILDFDSLAKYNQSNTQLCHLSALLVELSYHFTKQMRCKDVENYDNECLANIQICGQYVAQLAVDSVAGREVEDVYTYELSYIENGNNATPIKRKLFPDFREKYYIHVSPNGTFQPLSTTVSSYNIFAKQMTASNNFDINKSSQIISIPRSEFTHDMNPALFEPLNKNDYLDWVDGPPLEIQVNLIKTTAFSADILKYGLGKRFENWYAKQDKVNITDDGGMVSQIARYLIDSGLSLSIPIVDKTKLEEFTSEIKSKSCIEMLEEKCLGPQIKVKKIYRPWDTIIFEDFYPAKYDCPGIPLLKYIAKQLNNDFIPIGAVGTEIIMAMDLAEWIEDDNELTRILSLPSLGEKQKALQAAKLSRAEKGLGPIAHNNRVIKLESFPNSAVNKMSLCDYSDRSGSEWISPAHGTKGQHGNHSLPIYGYSIVDYDSGDLVSGDSNENTAVQFYCKNSWGSDFQKITFRIKLKDVSKFWPFFEMETTVTDVASDYDIGFYDMDKMPVDPSGKSCLEFFGNLFKYDVP